MRVQDASTGIRLTATVTGIAPWTAKYSRSDALYSPQRHPVSHPVKPRTRSRSCICRGRPGSSNRPCTPAAAARIAPSSRLPAAAARIRSCLPAAAARISHYRRRVLRLHLPLAFAAYATSPSCRHRVACLRLVLVVAARTPPRAGEPGRRWIYIHGQFKVRFSCT
jgi:hypothetical protein